MYLLLLLKATHRSFAFKYLFHKVCVPILSYACLLISHSKDMPLSSKFNTCTVGSRYLDLAYLE